MKLTEALLKLGFVQSHLDYSLFTKKNDASILILLVYVDDLLITGSNIDIITQTKEMLQKTFKIKDLGELRYFLGIKFTRSEKGILMHQRKYTLEIISEAGLGAARPASTPMDPNTKLTTIEYDEMITANKGEDEKKSISSEDKLLQDAGVYRRMVGKLLYLTVTRPYISFAIQTLSQFLHQTKQSHLDVAMRVVRYIKGQAGLGILLSSKPSKKMAVLCDADWATCLNTRRSVSGFLIKYGD
ncbi:uncharacterized mitochondrial protein AtMg00810-like [Lycium barbarum]|uniref:uncharacterized mitochondrial protein AtMg00810-like n=1 Tax=Lycium barbarum TaxID=112863 RepID=UPI00293EA45F|nr:uncharacterized mitochondrial protein AtMg00810-like [Lycium barbarum]